MDKQQKSDRKEVIISGAVRNSKSGTQYVMSKTFSIDDTIRNVSRYVSFLVFKDKKDDQKRTIIISESDKRFLTRDSKTQDSNDAVFVSAKAAKSSSGTSYIRSDTIDLEEVRRAFGTDYVFVLVTKPQKTQSEDQRTIVVKPSSAKYMPGASKQVKGGGYTTKANKTRDDEDEITI